MTAEQLHIVDLEAALREAERKFQRSQQRWGNLKRRVQDEIGELENTVMSPQQRSQYANGVARLNWVLYEMAKSPDVLAEAVKAPDVAEPRR